MVRLLRKIKGIVILVLLSSLTTVLLSCGKNEIDANGPFFPVLTKGVFWEYEVNEVEKYGNIDADITYAQKDEITDSYILNSKEFFTVKSYLRLTEESPWTYSGSYVLSGDETGIYKTEVEVKSQLLGYPIFKGQSWKSNHSINSTTNNTANIEEIQVPFVYQNSPFNTGIKVIEKSDSTGLANFQQFKVYDASLGMVYSEFKDIQYCQETDECLGKGIVTFNHRITKILLHTNASEIPAQ